MPPIPPPAIPLSLDIESRCRTIYQILIGPKQRNLLQLIVLLNLWVLFTRPQNSIALLDGAYLPLILSLLPLPFLLTRFFQVLCPQTKAMLGMLILGGIWVPLARNNAWALHTWVDLLQQFLAFYFPILLLFTSGNAIRSLRLIVVLIGLYLGAYASLHGGGGPGGFLGDENDICFVFVMILPFTLYPLPIAKNLSEKILYIVTLAAIFSGIVMSLSRGGFIGLVCVALYLIWKSPARLIILFFLGLSFGIAFYLAPQEYVSEIVSIKDTNTGTAKKRRDIWSVAFRVWADPPHIVAGVGMGNVRYYLRDYEPVTNQLASGTSIGGKAVHSMYLQLLAELGLLGVSLLGMFLYSSFEGNNRRIKKLRQWEKSYQQLAGSLHSSNKLQQALLFKSSPDQSPIKAEELAQFIQQTSRELRELEAFLGALNASFIGALSAGAFLSVLYYPPIWFMGTLSACVQRHVDKSEKALSLLTEVLSSRMEGTPDQSST